MSLNATDVSMTVHGQPMLAPVSAQVTAGECLAVTGANGSGKTTLLRIISGLMRPSTGTVILEGETVDERSAAGRSAIAALIGSPALYPDMTMGEHLELTCATWRIPTTQVAPLVDDTLSRFELTTLRQRFANELSSGQLQLFALAQVFIRPFSVLILDEPEQRLDAHRRTIVSDAIQSATHNGAAVVLASHNAELIDAVAHRRLALRASGETNAAA
jgi:ABC-type multidrug transport system ATPase subunit